MLLASPHFKEFLSVRLHLSNMNHWEIIPSTDGHVGSWQQQSSLKIAGKTNRPKGNSEFINTHTQKFILDLMYLPIWSNIRVPTYVTACVSHGEAWLHSCLAAEAQPDRVWFTPSSASSLVLALQPCLLEGSSRPPKTGRLLICKSPNAAVSEAAGPSPVACLCTPHAVISSISDVWAVHYSL